MTTTTEFLAEQKRLTEGATEGPWHDNHGEYGCVHIGNFGWVAAGPTGQSPEYDVDSEQGKADAEFIAHARTSVPKMTAALEAVLEVLRPHAEYQLRREVKFGRTESSCVCEQCKAWSAIEDALKGDDDDH